MDKNIIYISDTGQRMYYCPGCKCCHGLDERWTVVEKENKISITPSVKIEVDKGNTKETICHSTITDSIITFLPDCKHELAGQQIPMEDI